MNDKLKKLIKELSNKQSQLNKKNFAIEKIAKEINEIEDMHESKYNELMEILNEFQHEAGILREEISLLHEEIADTKEMIEKFDFYD